MMKSRKSRFLLTTAMLLAGISLASAQGTPPAAGSMSEKTNSGAEHGKSAGEPSHGAAAAPRGERMRTGEAAEAREKGSAEQHGTQRRESKRTADPGERQIGNDQARRGENGQTAGRSHATVDHDQAQRSSDNRASSHKEQGKLQSPDEKHEHNAAAEPSRDRDRDRASKSKDVKAEQPGQAQNAQQSERTTTGSNTQGQSSSQMKTNAQAKAQGGTIQSMSGRVSLSAGEQTELQHSVLHSRNVARVNANSIDFRLNTGVVVPRRFDLVSVATYPTLVDIYPAYRHDRFFVVNDEIVVVDRSRKIVDVIPAGPRVHFSHQGRMHNGDTAALELSPDEIRVVQRVLVDRGLLHGKVDGILGTKTRQALITFQRRKDLQATGTIDSRTVAALGVSGKISATQSAVDQGRRQSSSSSRQNADHMESRSNAPGPQDQSASTGPAGAQQHAGQASNEPGSRNSPSGQTTGQVHSAKEPSGNQNSSEHQKNSGASSGAASDGTPHR